jgi:hypothetical protein
MAAPTNLIVTFTGGTGSPVTVQIRASSDYNAMVHNWFLNGGLWFTNSSGVLQFIPWATITFITAQ